MAAEITSKFLDTDGYWKFSVTIPSGKGEAVYTYYYTSEGEADAKRAIALASASKIADTSFDSLGLENNTI